MIWNNVHEKTSPHKPDVFSSHTYLRCCTGQMRAAEGIQINDSRVSVMTSQKHQQQQVLSSLTFNNGSSKITHIPRLHSVVKTNCLIKLNMKHHFDWDLTWISLRFNPRTHCLCSTQKRMNEIYKVPHCKSRNFTRKMDIHRHYLKLRNNLHFSPIGLICWLIHVMHEIGDWGERTSVNEESWVHTGVLIMEIIQFHTFTSQHGRGTCERWPVQTVGGKQASSNLSVIWP